MTIMTSGHDPDKVDPTGQSGRPLLVTGAVIVLIAALAAMVVIYSILR